MTIVSPSEFKRGQLALRNWVLPDNLQVPTNLNFPVIDPPTVVVLEIPTYIHATPTTILTASHILPRTSTAQIHHLATDDGGETTDATVGFYFWWKNSSPNPVLLTNIASHLTINGKWEVDAACDVIFPGLNEASIFSSAQLRIVEFWNQPPSSPPTEHGQYRFVLDIDVTGGLCVTSPPGHPSTNKREWIINKNYGVKYSPLEVPPKGLLLFEVSLDTSTQILGGPCIAEVDASIVCPFLQFDAREAIHKGPPI
jgi:hypothetical protein